MTCLDRETAVAYLSGELNSSAADQTAAHLAQCGACRATVEEISDLIGCARELLLETDDRRLESDPPSAPTFLESVERNQHRLGLVRSPARHSAAHEDATTGQSLHSRRSPLQRSLLRRVAVVVAILIGAAAVSATGLPTMLVRAIRQAIPLAIDESNPRSPSRASGSSTDIALPTPPTVSTPPAAPTPRSATLAASRRLTTAALVTLEVDTLIALDRFDALVGGRLTVERSADAVIVRGLVEDVDRTQIRAVLHTLPNSFALQLQDMRTLAEAVERSASPVTTEYRPLTFDQGNIPVAVELRSYLLRHLSVTPDKVEDELYRMTNDAVRYSHRALLHAMTLESLAERVDAISPDANTPSTEDKWRALISKHANEVSLALDRLRHLIEPALRTSAEEESGSIAAVGELSSTSASEIRAAVVAIDDAIRLGLAASSEPPGEIKLRSSTFWRELREVERRARRLIH